MKKIECKWCHKLTSATALKECLGCWELRHRIEADIPLAIKIFDSLGYTTIPHAFHPLLEGGKYGSPELAARHDPRKK